MPPSDRAAWLARVERMTRQERLMALADAIFDMTGAIDGAEAVTTDVLKQFGHANRALDLIAALERDARAPAVAILREIALSRECCRQRVGSYRRRGAAMTRLVLRYRAFRLCGCPCWQAAWWAVRP